MNGAEPLHGLITSDLVCIYDMFCEDITTYVRKHETTPPQVSLNGCGVQSHD